MPPLPISSFAVFLALQQHANDLQLVPYRQAASLKQNTGVQNISGHNYSRQECSTVIPELLPTKPLFRKHSSCVS